MVYSDAHRLFLQLMSHRKSLDEREAKILMEKCCKEFKVKAKDLEGFVLELNLELKHMQLVVRSAMEEREDGDYPCLVLANLMASEATRELSSFSKQELSFMQQLVMEIVASEKGEVEINTALNIGPRLPQKLKPSMCEDLVDHLVTDKWLIKSWDDDGGEYVSLSALSITELAAYLEETFPEDVHKCFFCTKLTVKGYKCDQCNISVHRDCGKKYWADRNSYECPGEGCSASLRDQVDSGHHQSKRRRTRDVDQEDENMDEVETEEEEEEEEVEEVVKKGKGKASPRKSRGREKMDVSDDDDTEEEEEVEEVRQNGRGRASVRKSRGREIVGVSDDDATEEEEEEEEEEIMVVAKKEKGSSFRRLRSRE